MLFRFVRLFLIVFLTVATSVAALAQAEIPALNDSPPKAVPAPQAAPAQQQPVTQQATPPAANVQPAQAAPASQPGPATPAQAAPAAPAQAAPAPPPGGLVVEQQKALKSLVTKTDGLAKQIEQNSDDDGALVDIRLQLEDLARQALNTATVFRPRLTEIGSKLDQLGPPPAQGQPAEPEIVANERKALNNEKAEINAVIAGAQTLSLRITTMVDNISTLRSKLFRNLLTKRYALDKVVSSELVSDANSEFTNLYAAVSSWFGFVLKFKYQAALVATIMALVAAAVLLIGGRRLYGRVFEFNSNIEEPSYLSRLSLAFWSTLLPTLALGVFFFSTYFFFDYYGVLRGDIGVFLRALMSAIGVAFCVNRLTNAALSPRMPKWRLIPVESGPARWLVRLSTAMAVVLGINSFLSVVNEQMGSPLSLTVGRSFIATIIIGLILILMGLVRPFRTHTGEWRPWPVWLRYLAYALGLFTIIAALLGFIGLAIFLSIQIVVTGTILITAYIGFLSARAIGAEGGFAESSVGRWFAAQTNLEDGTLDQFGLATSIAINLLIVLVFLPLILLLWGFQPGDIQAWAYRLATGVKIGSVTISFTGILTGIVVFVVGYFVTRWFQAWLDDSVMARGRVDTGVRNSIRLIVGYAGMALAALIGVSAAGIDLSNLALIAGGLSLGLGFGLQNVVSNFVSGLILLAERPFKVGDWIVAGDVSGTVKKISVRATEIETFQRQSVILPNSNLINSAVGNWTHRNKLGRVEIKVGVAYGSDVRRVHEILLEIARGHPLVLKNPEPFVQFVNFGPNALDFEIRIFLADIMNGGSAQNDIRFAVIEAFTREGIEIPSAPRQAQPHIHHEPWPVDDDKTEALHAEKEAVKAEAERNRTKGRRKPRRPDPN
ncbi:MULTISPECIES: mechanosensitive ion channel family protein [Phyllobacteriaceae]|jgi:potassium-dependent mechanosensitive channel|uniref:mechanosensitive ion channel family protein n=1 Tax=Phyllobacteriaceae TaxID=69277 RepID=UPI000467A8E1|nr:MULTISPECIES: mechanosensitive ion channel domain-containing protein [Mesorhizobium]MBN9233739.1 mechanosensitive ion channel family protein [Mesorhizobium sp.]MDQ0328454.1 small-conductance mechanosensitive channel [Mesorhizobium sp. YL-MeA3-2017]